MDCNLKIAVAAIFMGSAVLLAGCSQNAGPEGKRSFSWYVKHQNARHKEEQWCSHIPAKKAFSSKWLKSQAGIACCQASNASTAGLYAYKIGDITIVNPNCNNN